MTATDMKAVRKVISVMEIQVPEDVALLDLETAALAENSDALVSDGQVVVTPEQLADMIPAVEQDIKDMPAFTEEYTVLLEFLKASKEVATECNWIAFIQKQSA